MLHAGRHEEQVARREAMPVGPIAEASGTFDDDVDLVPGVGFLGIVLPRGVELDAQGAMPEELDVPLPRGAGQPGQRIGRR